MYKVVNKYDMARNWIFYIWYIINNSLDFNPIRDFKCENYTPRVYFFKIHVIICFYSLL